MSVSVEDQLRAGLLAQSSINSVIGNRLYLLQLPQNPTYPCARYKRTFTSLLYTQENTLQGTAGYVRFQLTAYFQGASSGQNAIDFAQAVIAALQTFTCAFPPGSPPVLGTPPNFVLNWFVDQQPQTQPPIFMAVVDLKIWFNQQ